MWKNVNNDIDLSEFMHKVEFFHDSCIKEIKYTSGAYVNKDLFMYPINDKRILRITIQRQSPELPMFEMEFSGLKFFKLFPLDETYTCEITSSTMFFKKELIYWTECDSHDEKDDVTVVCAQKFRWRCVENHLGNEDFYNPVW